MKTVEYKIPVEVDGSVSYEQVSIETEASAVIEEDNRTFVKKEEREFLDANLSDILLKKNVVNTLTSTSTNTPLSGAMGKILNDKLGGVEIVVGRANERPSPKPGVNILFIEIE